MTLVGDVTQAIDADLERQAAVQGAAYYPAHADDAGVGGADMCIVIGEVARAVIPIILEAAAKAVGMEDRAGRDWIKTAFGTRLRPKPRRGSANSARA